MAVNDREWMHEVFHARPYAAAVRQIQERAADVFAVAAGAATADADAARLHEEAERRRRVGAASVVDAVLEVAPLRVGLDAESAADVLSLFTSWTGYEHLVRRRGWEPDRFEAWLADTMVRQLLG